MFSHSLLRLRNGSPKALVWIVFLCLQTDLGFTAAKVSSKHNKDKKWDLKAWEWRISNYLHWDASADLLLQQRDKEKNEREERSENKQKELKKESYVWNVITAVSNFIFMRGWIM